MFSFLRKLRRKSKAKEKTFKELDEENIEKFLEEVTKSVDENFSGQESNQLEESFRHELNIWLRNTIFAGKKLDPDAVKFGVVLGITETLRKVNEAEEQERVTSYIR